MRQRQFFSSIFNPNLKTFLVHCAVVFLISVSRVSEFCYFMMILIQTNIPRRFSEAFCVTASLFAFTMRQTDLSCEVHNNDGEYSHVTFLHLCGDTTSR